MSLKIVTYPAKVLSRPGRKIAKGGDVDLAELYREMVGTMEVEGGIGLAAPQVGKSIRFLVAHDSLGGVTYGMANPHIITMSDERTIGNEGCLSFPGVYGEVERAKRITVRYLDLDYDQHEEEFEDYFARIVQHEIDHLNGVLLIDRAIGGLVDVTQEDEEDFGDNEGDDEQPELPLDASPANEANSQRKVSE